MKKRQAGDRLPKCATAGCIKLVWCEPGKEQGGYHYQCQKHETEKYKSINEEKYKDFILVEKGGFKLSGVTINSRKMKPKQV